MPSFRRSLAASLVFALASTVNPMFLAGCFVDEGNDFEFGEAEMLTLLETGNETFDFESGGKSYALMLSIAQSAATARLDASPSLFQTASACGSRSFEQSAAACITISSMPAAGTFTLVETTGGETRVVLEDVPVRGTLFVHGETLSNGYLELSFNDGDSTQDTFALARDASNTLVLERFVASREGATFAASR